MIDPVCQLLWGKWRQPRKYHPLICHLLDVASVAAALSPNHQAGLRKSSYFRTEESGLWSWVPFLISTHDLGKAAPAFQVHPGFSLTIVDAVRQRLAAAGLPCPIVPTPIRHGTITALVLPDLLCSSLVTDLDSARLFARIVAGHHGIFPTAADLSDAAMHPDSIGGEP
jgi:CRISPR-associated endonuclease/helicase Cas3